jgi:hypothetical protein
VHGQLANLYKVAINASRPALKLIAPAIHDAFPGTGQEDEQRRAIIPCEINAIVKSLPGQPKKEGEIAQIAPHQQNSIHVWDSWEQVGALAGNSHCHLRSGKILA